MMRYFQRLMNTMILALLFAVALSAQYDDVYFDPEDADEVYAAIEDEKLVKNYSAPEASSSADDYDYYYTSRIKRFYTPYYGFDFYSPVYVDPYYYDPFYAGFYYPSSTIYYTPTANWNNRWRTGTYTSVYNVYNYPSYGYPGYGYGGTTVVTTTVFGGYPSYGGFSGGYGGFYGGGGVYGGGFAGGGYNAYCPPSSYGTIITGVPVNGGSGTTPGTRGNSNPGTYYGPRGTGSVNASPRQPVDNGGGSAPDRPYTTAGTPNTTPSDVSRPTYSPRATSGTTTTRTVGTTPSYVPRNDRPVYTPPSGVTTRTTDRTRTTTSDRFTTPSRPTTRTYEPASPSSRSYSPASRSYSPSSRSVSPSSSPTRSSASPRSSGGSSPRSSSSSGGRSPR